MEILKDELGIKKILYTDPSGDLVIATEQNVTDIVERNKQEYNAFNERTRYSDINKVASIPMSIFMALPLDIRTGKDQEGLKKWLNDRDNSVFRTRPGKI